MSDSSLPARIVVVEDNPADVRLVREALRSHEIQFELTHLNDGAEAIAQLCGDTQALIPDLILLDLNMPKVGGLEVLAAVRKSRAISTVPVIVITSSPAPEEQDAARRLGAIAYVRKPSDLYDFIREIGSAVRDALHARNNAI